jgi:2-iminoacetate synthase ThiH
MLGRRLIALIREAGRVPVERDCLYQEVRRYDNQEAVAMA